LTEEIKPVAENEHDESENQAEENGENSVTNLNVFLHETFRSFPGGTEAISADTTDA
jgi:hypothetical protein